MLFSSCGVFGAFSGCFREKLNKRPGLLGRPHCKGVRFSEVFLPCAGIFLSHAFLRFFFLSHAYHTETGNSRSAVVEGGRAAGRKFPVFLGGTRNIIRARAINQKPPGLALHRRALRRTAGLVFLLVFWGALAGACQWHGVGGLAFFFCVIHRHH